MADKAFNEKPMIVVVSDALDPRTKRQLQAQLQSEMMTISEVDAEVKNATAMENIKQQYDTAKDSSKFDDNETKEETPPKPIEEGKPTENADTGTGNADDAFGGGNDAGAEGSNPTNGEASNTNVQESGQNNDGSGANVGSENSDVFGNGEGDNGNSNSNNQAGTANNSTDDAFKQSDENKPVAGEQSPQNQQSNQQGQQNQQPDQSQQQQSQQGQAQQNAGGDGEDDPFAENQPTFESFAGILGLKYESVETQTAESNLPPMKQLTYIRGTDQGVDDRTNGVVATLEDPQNTIVVLDLGNVTEAEAKMQFQAVKKQMQERGITVVDTIDQAIEFLNEVYEQIAGKAE